MKEIQGKIKFVAIPLINGMIGYLPLRYEKIGLLSEITEEQAAEFVECTNISTLEEPLIVYTNYFNEYKWFDKPKESLISLLKANDVWIKEWMAMPKYEDYVNQAYCYDFIPDKYKYNKLPDDLLLIKLT